MKKLVYILLLFSGLCFAQKPLSAPVGVMPGPKTTSQIAAITSPVTGTLIFNSTLGQYQYYNGSAWVAFTGGASGDLQAVVNNGGEVFDTTGEKFNLRIVPESAEFEVMAYEGGFGYSDGSQFIVNKEALSSLNTLGDNSALIQLTSGRLLIREYTPSFQQSLVFETGIANTTIKIPAKPEGTYTLATLEDISGGSGTVTSVTGTNGVTVASGTTTPVIGLGNITPTSVNASGNIQGATYGSDGSVSDAELLRINSLTSNAQTQLDTNSAAIAANTSAIALKADDSATVHKTGAETIAGVKTFSSTISGSIDGNAATVTTNANLTGDVTSSGNATTYNNVVPANKGGAGTVSGLLKADGSGTVSAAVSGTDYNVSQVANDLTSSSTIAPSKTAVNTALAGYVKVLAKSTTNTTAVTGVAATDVLTFAAPIASGELSVGNVIRFWAAISKTGISGTSQFKLWVNTTASLSGATLIGTAQVNTNTNIGYGFQRHINCQASNTLEFYDTGSGIMYENASATGARDTATINYTGLFYIIGSIANSNTADSTTIATYLIERL